MNHVTTATLISALAIATASISAHAQETQAEKQEALATTCYSAFESLKDG